MRKMIVLLVLVLGLTANGCTNMSPEGQGTMSGAMLGAGAGAGIAAIAGGNAGIGALIGGALGATAGYMKGKQTRR